MGLGWAEKRRSTMVATRPSIGVRFALAALVPVIVALVLVDGPSTIPPLGAAVGFAIK